MNNFHFHTDAKGKDLSKLINNYNLTILNDGTPTTADFATAPDLTLATTEMSPHTTWNPINQSCGSEHLPILISLGVKYSATGTSNKSRWKLNKADCGIPVNFQKFSWGRQRANQRFWPIFLTTKRAGKISWNFHGGDIFLTYKQA